MSMLLHAAVHLASAVGCCAELVCYAREAQLHFRGGSSVLADTRAGRVARADLDSAVLTQSTLLGVDLMCADLG